MEFDIGLLEYGPSKGMEFPSKEHLFEAYLAHGKHKGFGVATRSTRGEKYMLICCDRGRKSEAKKMSKRFECKARLNAIKQDSGTWKVSKVDSSHNHDLHPSMTIFMASHRTMSVSMKRQLEAYDIAGLRPCKSVRLMEAVAGGPSNLRCLDKDCRYYIEQRRRLRLGEGDVDAIHRLFLRLQKQDRNLFHLMDIDDEGKLRSVMWIHPRSIAAYEDFNDVVSFDTTYLVNKYRMPFATVVGVNHHHQSTLLGCCLMSHEDSDSFRWFFKNWLDAMGGVKPTTILTDQCESIRGAVREVMPETIHRLCLWHILCKTSENFKHVTEFSKATSAFRQLIFNCRSIEEFEAGWDDFIVEYRLQNNRWLRDLYDERESWVHVYLNSYFWAGMVSTQRSESMNAFFDDYIHPKSTLKQFVEQYEIALTDKVHKEMRADYNSRIRPLKMTRDFKWAQQFPSRTKRTSQR